MLKLIYKPKTFLEAGDHISTFYLFLLMSFSNIKAENNNEKIKTKDFLADEVIFKSIFFHWSLRII